MKKKTIIQMMIGILFLLTLIISSTYAYFNIVNTSSNNTTSNYNAKLEDIEKYGTSLLTGGEGELHLRVKASDMTPSKIGNKYYATTSDDDYQLRRGNHVVSKATIQKGLSNYEYNCTSKLTITLDGTMVSEDGLQVGDAKLYLRGTNNNIKNEEYDLKNLIDELELNDDDKKIYTREIEYLLTSDNEGKVMIDVEFANNSNNQITSSGKNINIEITNSELVCGLGNNKVYVQMDTWTYGSDARTYRTTEWRNKIITTSFVKYKPSEEELTTKPIYWDLTDTSKSEAGSVIGWLEEREETDTYDLYIGSDKEIYATTLDAAFYKMAKLQEIKFNNLNTSETINMSQMFRDCSSLNTLDVSSFNTSKVTTMSSMFSGCSNLKTLDLSNFDTSSVTNMDSMFRSYKGTTLDLSNFDTSKVTYMPSIFYGCRNLTSLDISNFDISKVTNMSYMFAYLDSITSIDQIKGFKELNTSSATNMSSMFYGCKNLTSIDVSHFDISKVTNMHSMFNGLGVKSLEDINGLYEFDTSKVTDIGGIFADCKNLTEIDLTKFELDSVTDMSLMFVGLDSITSIDQIKGFKELDTSKVTNMSFMFGSSNITELDLSHFDTSSVTDMSWMFSYFKGTTLDLSSFETTLLANTQYMFNGCKNLKDLKLNKATFDKVTSYVSMFNGVPNDIHLTIKKGQETFINDRLNDAKKTNYKIDLVD